MNYDQTLASLCLKVEGLEAKNSRLGELEIQHLQQVDKLKQDRVAVVAKVVPSIAMKLFWSDEMGYSVAQLVKVAIVHGRSVAFEEVAALEEPFELDKMHGYRPSAKEDFHKAGDDLAAATFPFLVKATFDPFAPFEELLSKKPKTLQPTVKHAPSHPTSRLKPSSSKATNQDSWRSPFRR